MNEIEQWIDIEGYEGLYQISDLGNIKSLERKHEQDNGFGTKYTKIVKERILAQAIAPNGYSVLNLNNSGKKQFAVHRLVAQAFIPNPEDKPQVNHINGIKTDNRAINLEWATKSENQIHAYETGLQKKNKMFTDDQVKAIREDKGLKRKDLAKKYSCGIKTIDNIINYRNAYKL